MNHPRELGTTLSKEYPAMTKTRSWGARAAAVAAVVGLLAGTAGVVNAQPDDGVDVAFNIAAGGTLSVPGLVDDFDIPVPNPNPAQLEGVWSPTTGDFVGNLTGSSFIVQISNPIDITIEVSFGSTSVSGTIPPDGTTGSLTVSGFTYTARDTGTPSLADCTLPGEDVELAATLVPGEPLGLELTGDLILFIQPTAEPAASPAAVIPGCELLASLLPPDTATFLVPVDLRLAQVTAPAPTPEPTPEPAPQPVVAKPAFTG